ncbi:hypothetical protein [Ruegeria arenilitoris]|uniref:hypothetical protein n=1 Tax=Ruegeria arenilitoris TaxID=1173585 RepID=UPI00147B8E3F|nr:hypothetical protein [Ruegeria arenilitoris]
MKSFTFALLALIFIPTNAVAESAVILSASEDARIKSTLASSKFEFGISKFRYVSAELDRMSSEGQSTDAETTQMLQKILEQFKIDILDASKYYYETAGHLDAGDRLPDQLSLVQFPESTSENAKESIKLYFDNILLIGKKPPTSPPDAYYFAGDLLSEFIGENLTEIDTVISTSDFGPRKTVGDRLTIITQILSGLTEVLNLEL